MEIQLSELIEQIKKDGVAAAEAEAAAIIEKARLQAEKIVADAKAQSDKILTDAKNENARMVKSGEDAIRQAGRNLLISFRESVTRELKVILAENVEAVYSSATLSQLICDVIAGWAGKPDAESITVFMNEDKLKALEENILSGLKSRLTGGIILKANDNFDGGFRICENNGSAYYDYSAEAVVDMLSSYLSPRITELLKEA